MIDVTTVIVWVIVMVVFIIAYPFAVMWTAKMAAWGWCRGQQLFHTDKEIQDGDATEEETETKRTGLGQEKGR